MPLTDDPHDPRLTRGWDDAPTEMAEAYLILSDEERAKGFVRPVRRKYLHDPMLGGCGVVTVMGLELAETYARDPKFYGATWCVGCKMHKPVGGHGEFVWDDAPTVKVGT